MRIFWLTRFDEARGYNARSISHGWCQANITPEHGYDCIYQGSTPRAWERTVDASYVESLERKVQILEANSSTATQSAASQHPYLPQLPKLESPEYRPNEQQATESSAGALYGPISTTNVHSQTSGVHQNSSRVRSRDHDSARSKTVEDDVLSEAPLETEVRDVNTYTEVCVF